MCSYPTTGGNKYIKLLCHSGNHPRGKGKTKSRFWSCSLIKFFITLPNLSQFRIGRFFIVIILKSIPKGENNLFCYETLYNQQFYRKNNSIAAKYQVIVLNFTIVYIKSFILLSFSIIIESADWQRIEWRLKVFQKCINHRILYKKRFFRIVKYVIHAKKY